MNELELKEEFNLLIPDGYVEAYRKYEEDKVRLQMLDAMFKESAENFLEEHGLTEFDQGEIEISRTKDFTKKVVDTQRLKDEGLYELYTKDSLVKGHINIKVHYDD
jgi:hypothetical protein